MGMQSCPRHPTGSNIYRKWSLTNCTTAAGQLIPHTVVGKRWLCAAFERQAMLLVHIVVEETVVSEQFIVFVEVVP